MFKAKNCFLYYSTDVSFTYIIIKKYRKKIRKNSGGICELFQCDHNG